MVGWKDLPRELVVYIIDIAEAAYKVDSAFFENSVAPSRRATLRSLCLVQRSWSEIAQAALFRRVAISEDKEIRAITKSDALGRWPIKRLELSRCSSCLFKIFLDRLIVNNSSLGLYQLSLSDMYVDAMHLWDLCHPALRDLRVLEVVTPLKGSMPPEYLPSQIRSLELDPDDRQSHRGSKELLIQASHKSLEEITLKFFEIRDGRTPLSIPGPDRIKLWKALEFVSDTLKILNISGMQEPTRNCISFISSLRQLDELTLSQTKSVEPYVKQLRTQIRLKKLTIFGQNDSTDSEAPQTVVNLMGKYVQLKGLKELNLPYHSKSCLKRMKRRGELGWLDVLKSEKVEVWFGLHHL